jgi:multidrug efflux pump subunit AcrB
LLVTALTAAACERSTRPITDASPPTPPDAGHVVHARIVVDLARADAMGVSRPEILEALSRSLVTIIGSHEAEHDTLHGGGRTLTLDVGNENPSVEKIGSAIIHITHGSHNYLRDIATVEMAAPP